MPYIEVFTSANFKRVDFKALMFIWYMANANCELFALVGKQTEIVQNVKKLHITCCRNLSKCTNVVIKIALWTLPYFADCKSRSAMRKQTAAEWDFS